MLFKIRDDEGLKYSKISGDNNKINIDNLTGYNPIFGEKFFHVAHVLSKIFKNNFLKKIILFKKKFNIYYQFFDFIKHNKNIVVKKNKNKFNIFQKSKIKICILIHKKNILHLVKKYKKLVKSFRLNKKLPLIKNILLNDKFNIEFETLERTIVKKINFY